MKNLVKFVSVMGLMSLASNALADDVWYPGKYSGSSQWMTCVGDAGSDGGPYYTVSGIAESAAQSAYDQALEFVNIADRNPAYIVVTCK